MTDGRVFLDTVRERAQGTPYAVTPTERGFDVQLDLADVRWHGLLDEARLRSRCTYHVRLDPGAGTFSVLEQRDAVAWQVGAAGGRVPVARLRAGRSSGRSYQYRFHREVGRDAQGHLRREGELTLVPQEGRELITTAAGELGWREVRSGIEKGAIAVAVGTAVLLVVGGLVAAVVLLLLR